MDNNTLVKRVFTVSLLAAGLAACSGASNTINSSAGGTDPSTRTTCNNELNCIQIEFVDDPVINLNYSCGSVVNVTDERGVAVCPSNSRVEFYLQSTKSLRRVVLGNVLVQPAGQSILRITPLDLVTNRADVTQLSSPNAVTAINIARFLQALRERDAAGVELEPFIATAPVNRIRVTDQLKDQLDVLTEDVLAITFGSDQFATKLLPFLEATNRTLISPEQAQARLLTTLKVIKTGVYFGTPAITLPSQLGGTPALDGLTGNTQINDLRLGIEGEAAPDNQSSNSGLLRSTMALYGLVDRDGAHVGQAMQWTGRASTSEGIYNLYRQNSFDKLRPANTLGGFDPITDQVNGQWQWRSVSTPEKIVDFNEGRLLRNYSMVGSRKLYENFTTDKNEPAAGIIGRWIQRAVAIPKPDGTVENLPEIKGTATISKVASVNSFFDRTVWRTPDTIQVGQRSIFPLHATLRFRYGTVQEGCPQGGCTDLPDLSVTILESGNIISDFAAGSDPLGAAGNCAAVNPVTLKDAEGVQEYRVGTVRAAYTGTNPDDLFIGPTMLFSGNIFGVHDGLQIASLAATPRVKINVAGTLSNSTVPTINITDSSTAETESDGQDAAKWGHIYNAYLAFYDTTGLTDAQKQIYVDARKKQQGTVTATVTPCYPSALERDKK